MAGGGASGLNVVPIARELGCRRVLLPSTASALSACGALFADIVSEFSHSRYDGDPLARPRRRERGARATSSAQADAFLAGLDALPVTGDAQGLPRRGALPRPGLGARRAASRGGSTTDEDVRAVEEAFHADARARSSPCASRASTSSACSGRRVRRPCSTSRSCGRDERAAGAGGAESTATPTSRRPASATVRTLRRRRRSPPGRRIERPGRSSREPTTTIVVYPGSTRAS